MRVRKREKRKNGNHNCQLVSENRKSLLKVRVKTATTSKCTSMKSFSLLHLLHFDYDSLRLGILCFAIGFIGRKRNALTRDCDSC